MEGSGGVLGCLVTHCVEWSHLLLHCMCVGMVRGVSFQGWFWILGLGFVGTELELECKQVVKPGVDVGVDLEVGMHVEVVVEHMTGEHDEVAVVVSVATELIEGDVMEDVLEETVEDEVLLDVNVEVLRHKVVGKVLEEERGVVGEEFVTMVDEMVK